MALNQAVSDVTERIIVRSRSTRSAYLVQYARGQHPRAQP